MKDFKQLLFGVLACGSALAAAAQPAAAPDDAGSSQIARVNRVQAETVSAFQWTIKTEQQLAAQPGSPKAADLPRAVSEAQSAHTKKIEELEALSRRLNELLAALAAGEAENTNLNQMTDEWEKRLAASKSELAALTKQESELMRRFTEEGQGNGLATGVAAGDRKSIVVSINHNFVAPLATPYFRGKQISFSDGDRGVEISAGQEGVPLGKALEDGGWLAKELDSATPEKNYVSVLLASDSVATYYALLKELHRRKLRQTWETWDGVSFFIITYHIPGNSGGGSRRTTVY